MKQFLTLTFLLLVSLYGKAQSVITKQENGFFNITELGFHAGEYKADIVDSIGKSSMANDYIPFISSVNKSVTVLGIQTISGYFFTPKLSLGLGLGIERYNGINRTAVPVFVDLRYYFKDARNTLFTYGDVGHSFGTSLSGTLFNLGLGYKFMVSKTLALNASAGYHAQDVNNEYQNTWNKRPLIQAFNLKVGILF